jgi:hypothetical protein
MTGCSTDIQVVNAEDDSAGGVTPLYVAVSMYSAVADFEEVLQSLIDGGCQLDRSVCAPDSIDSETPLYRALDVDKADFAWILVQHGASVDVECPHGVTILNKVSQSCAVVGLSLRAAEQAVVDRLTIRS